MALLLVWAGGMLVVLPALARPLGRRVRPAEWARLCGLALIAGAVCLELGLVLYGAPAVLRAAGLPFLDTRCRWLLCSLVVGGAPAGWAAATAAVLMPVLAASGALRARRGCRDIWVEQGLGEHRQFGRYELVVLPTPHPVAVSVARPNGQILVSQGMVDALEPQELQLVLSHEAAHLDHNHQRWLVLAAAIEHGMAVIPFVRRSTATLRAALEHWADEAAASDDVGRRTALRGALLQVTRALVSPAAAFSAADTVMERLAALEAAPAAPNWASRSVLYLPGAAVALVLLATVGISVADLGTVLAMAGRCLA
jgi:Zn-dependent protease with chaperone function